MLLAAFLAREATASNPLVPLRILRVRAVVAANTIQILSVAGMFGMFFLGALYLRRVLHYDALQIGLVLPARDVRDGHALDPLLRAHRDALRPARRAARGDAADHGGLALFARAGRARELRRPTCCPRWLLLGIGAGVAFPSLMAVAMSGATPQDAGLASGLVNTTAQVGGALGLAVLATLSDVAQPHALATRGRRRPPRSTGGYHLAFWIAAALVACAIAVVLTALPRAAAGGRARRGTGRGRRGGLSAAAAAASARAAQD